MATARQPAVAGQFYPEDRGELHTMLMQLLDNAGESEALPKAVIAPHAGFVYSGSVAASAYAPLKKYADTIRHVVLLGPAHRVAFNGLAVPTVDSFVTPLGEVSLNKKAIDTICQLDFVRKNDEAHREEHSLEVHIPFLQEVLLNFTLTPLVVGDASAEEVGQVLETLWGKDDTLIVVSTDLSHYHDYETASKMDLKTTYDIEDLNYQELNGKMACGARPVKGLLHYAKQHDLVVKAVDFCNSGDTAGPRDRVVGYASFYCGEKEKLGSFLSKPQKRLLLKFAYMSIKYRLEHGEDPKSMQISPRFDYDTPVATFVTIEKQGELRGCIGSLQPIRPILQDIMHNACAAAFTDQRFPPVTKEEFPELEIYISLISEFEPLTFESEQDLKEQLRPGIDGLVLSYKNHRGTFLPTVWKSIPNPKGFIRNLKLKAGLDPDFWDDAIEVKRYTTEIIDKSILNI